MIECRAPAKVNLALHVTGQRDDNYHDLDTLVGFAGEGDRILVGPQDGGGIDFKSTGPFAAQLPSGANANLAVRAARSLQRAAWRSGHKIPGASLILEKNLPVASGIGGGSADAAAALLALKQFWKLPDDFSLREIASELGADAAMCLESSNARATGIGDRVQPIIGARILPALLVNPGIEVATPDVFAALGSRRNAGIGVLPADPFDPRYLSTLRNDLEATAIRLFPVIGEALRLLAELKNCRLARMSGSGATCFGLFGSSGEAAAARRRIVDSMPDWWCVATLIGNPRQHPRIVQTTS